MINSKKLQIRKDQVVLNALKFLKDTGGFNRPSKLSLNSTSHDPDAWYIEEVEFLEVGTDDIKAMCISTAVTFNNPFKIVMQFDQGELADYSAHMEANCGLRIGSYDPSWYIITKQVPSEYVPEIDKLIHEIVDPRLETFKKLAATIPPSLRDHCAHWVAVSELDNILMRAKLEAESWKESNKHLYPEPVNTLNL